MQTETEVKTPFGWEAASPRERDAWIAEHLLGWLWVRWSDDLINTEAKCAGGPPHDKKAVMVRPADWRKTFEAETIGAWDGEKHVEVRRWQLADESDPRLLSVLPDFNIPGFSSDHRDAAEIRKAIKGQGKVPEFIHYLARVLHTKLVKMDVQDDARDIFALIDATPEQQAHAAYLALTKG